MHLAVRRGGLVALGLGAVVGLTALFYLASVHAAPGNADGASIVLEGKALFAGNVALDHWTLSLDSFWLIDALFYGAATAIGGLRPDLLHLVPAVIAAAVVTLGAYLAGRGRPSWPAAAGAVTVFALLGLPTLAFTRFFVMGPLHVGTTLWCLLAFLCLARTRFGPGFAAAVAILAAGLLSDLQTLAVGVVPVALAGLATMVRRREWRAGLPAVVAAPASLAVAAAVRRLALVLGTFTDHADSNLATLHQMLNNIAHLPRYGAALLGVGTWPYAEPHESLLVALAHVLGLVLVLLAVAAAATALAAAAVRGQDRTGAHAKGDAARAENAFCDDVLLFGFLGGVAVFVVLSFVDGSSFGRYLTASVVFGAILAGRAVSRACTAMPTVTPVAAFMLAALLAGSAATYVATASAAPPPQGVLELAHYLEHNHLDHGLGDYWSAPITTLESDGRVVIRPVITLHGTLHLVRYRHESTSTWYRRSFSFLVYNASQPWGGVGANAAAQSFGPPAHVAVVGAFRVLTWKHPIRVLPDGRWRPSTVSETARNSRLHRFRPRASNRGATSALSKTDHVFVVLKQQKEASE